MNVTIQTEGSGWLSDVTPVAWIRPQLHPFNQDIGSVIPDGFEAYCRIFHPVKNHPKMKTWTAVAAAHGRIAHPEMQFHMINRPVGAPPPLRYVKDPAVKWGRIPEGVRTVLIDGLRHWTTTPERCWFCVWEGRGGMDDQGVTARVRHPQRDYFLYSGSIEALPHPDSFGDREFPNLWWPEDRAWVVATEIDFAWTYVGGTLAHIDALLSDTRIEALPAKITDKPFYNSDTINAALDGNLEP
jgi:hypothetical protein